MNSLSQYLANAVGWNGERRVRVDGLLVFVVTHRGADSAWTADEVQHQDLENGRIHPDYMLACDNAIVGCERHRSIGVEVEAVLGKSRHVY